ncbi:MAG: Fur family transcriptional regulator [Desulfobacteraceae bacterium]|nr:MAG: Fur family transcriptional regulator [Desulfobacteraceae bacterium]
MINNHEQEKKQFKRLFSHLGIDEFDRRFQVLEAFLKLEKHVTGSDIDLQLKEDGIILDQDFIDQSMELLCRFGFASRMEFDHGPPRYEHRHLGLHHDHMICTKCGTILEFRDESLETHQIEVTRAYGFHMLQHKMEIYGICADCMKKRSPLVSLDKAKQGEQLIIRQIEAGRNLQMRVTSMGIRTGDRIEVVSAQAGGQVVIAAGENRLIIGKGMSQKIMVEPHDSAALHTAPEGAAPFKLRQTRLSDMKAGQEGIISKVSGKGTLRRRLLEMGINRGTRVYVEKYAPLRDPIELVIKGYHISLRVEEASHILVEDVNIAQRRS